MEEEKNTPPSLLKVDEYLESIASRSSLHAMICCHIAETFPQFTEHYCQKITPDNSVYSHAQFELANYYYNSGLSAGEEEARDLRLKKALSCALRSYHYQLVEQRPPDSKEEAPSPPGERQLIERIIQSFLKPNTLGLVPFAVPQVLEEDLNGFCSLHTEKVRSATTA